MTTQTRLSIEQFLAGDWPADTQLVDGEVVMNDPAIGHQRITGRIFQALANWADVAGGEAGIGANWTLAEGQVFKPDVWWTRTPAWSSATAVRCDTPPDLVVEVRSPGTWRYDRPGSLRKSHQAASTRPLGAADTAGSSWRYPCATSSSLSLMASLNVRPPSVERR